MDKLSIQKRAAILQCLCEGNSIASTTRITGAAKNTILDLLATTAEACEAHMDRAIVNLRSSRIELDEIWSFVHHKNKGKEDPSALIHDPKEGNVWVWKCICADSRLLVGWHAGGRTFENAVKFCRSIASRFAVKPQISTDGLNSYPMAIYYAFGDCDYSRLIKLYGKDGMGNDVCIGARKQRVQGFPDMTQTCTSYVERSNLTLRMQNRRFTRKTNAHSKNVGNHCRMLAIGFFHYNFIRRNLSIRTTPAVAAGIASREWTMADMVQMADTYASERQERAFEAAFAGMQNWRQRAA